jgi:SAM-dependent methyltransferase
MFDYDAELHRYHVRLLPAFELCPGDHVLDIGCGTGQTTRDAARAVGTGSALGVDVSERMVATARRLTRDAGLHNATFVEADAQTHAFSDEWFDVGVSRFGTMFFGDPTAAFANIARAMRSDARLVQLVWQTRERQEWSTVLDEVFGDEYVPMTSAGPFSLADPDTTRAILAGAGFTDVEVVGLDEPVWYGRDATGARTAMLALQGTKSRLEPLDARCREDALDRLHTALAARCTDRGVFFDAHAWLITARRRP